MKTNSLKAIVGAALAVASCAALAQPAISASGTTLTFPSTPLFVTSTAPSPATITLTNTGSEVLTITGITPSGANATEFTATGTCVGDSVKVDKNATCTIGATFTPLVAGSRSATFSVQSNAATNPSITLSATGQTVATPSIVLNSTSLVFNTQTVGVPSAPRRITVTNNSTVAVSGIQVNSSNPDFATTTTCQNINNALDFAEVCTIDITFTPSMAAAITGTVTITSNVNPPRTVALSGPGVAVGMEVGAARLEASTLSFPETPSGVTATVMKTTLKNTGNKELALTAIALNGTNAAEFASSAGTTCAAGMLLVDESCVLEVNFKPESAGSKSASLVVTHDAGTSTVALSGTGTAPPAPPPSSTPAPTTPTPAPAAPSGSNDGGGGALGGLGLLFLIPPLVLRARRLSLAP